MAIFAVLFSVLDHGAFLFSFSSSFLVSLSTLPFFHLSEARKEGKKAGRNNGPSQRMQRKKNKKALKRKGQEQKKSGEG